MPNPRSIIVLSDIHYAGAAERARGVTEYSVIENRLLRWLVRAWRHFVWRRDPFAHNHLLDQFIVAARGADMVVANGDYSCDTAFVGLSDQPSFESARECVGRLREAFAGNVCFTIGDHELGKTSLFGNRGGLRLASWGRAAEIDLEPFWCREIGDFIILGVTSSLVALPIYQPETMPDEWDSWCELRDAHLQTIRDAFDRLRPRQRILLFCHDPTGLPFLLRDPVIRSRVSQVSCTVIGHLHSNLFFWKSRLLAGMPAISFLGNSIRRMSVALHEAREWTPFRPVLCPALAGIQLLNDGGYLKIDLSEDGRIPPHISSHRLTARL